MALAAEETRDTLLQNIDRLHTTALGAERIRKNLALDDADIVARCKALILDPGAGIERRGKNWYVRAHGAVLTINARSCTIITAHREAQVPDAPRAGRGGAV